MIFNIHYLHPEPVNLATQVQAAREEVLVNDHRNGMHPYGEKRRDCPLCRLGY